MIKKYNQFVKDINEAAGQPAPQPAPERAPSAPTIAPEPDTIPDTPTRPRPTRPGFTPTEIPAEEDAPLASYEEEEEEEDIYSSKLKELADMLGVDVVDNSIDYKGHKIIFPSETEMFHVDRKKFRTAEQTMQYLNSLDTNDELEDIDEDEYEKGDISFESRSYRSKAVRRFRK